MKTPRLEAPLSTQFLRRNVRQPPRHVKFVSSRGVGGGEIPLGARIVAVAESFHGMVSDLHYKSFRAFEDALAQLRRCSGTKFDPQVVMTFFYWLQVHGDLQA